MRMIEVMMVKIIAAYYAECCAAFVSLTHNPRIKSIRNQSQMLLSLLTQMNGFQTPLIFLDRC